MKQRKEFKDREQQAFNIQVLLRLGKNLQSQEVQ
jgi:hypothetical protein